MSQKGEILVMSLIILTLVFINTILIMSGSLTFSQSSRYSTEEIQAVNLAEAGVDKAISSLNTLGGEYTGDEEITLGNGSFSVTVTSPDAATKIIKSTGYIPNKVKPKVKRTIEITAAVGVGASFVYGIQVGEGGLELGNSNQVLGSIYSNGNITAGSNNEITGDAFVAGGPQPTANQLSECVDPNCLNQLFGKRVDDNNILDVAQSFKPSITAPLNKVSVRLKKTGTPPNLIVRVLGDNDGNPNKNNVLASGTLYASLVTPDYSWVDITFNSSPTVNAETTYWLVFDTSSDTNNFWSWSYDSTQGYTRGNAKWSSNWQAGNPTWVNITGDLDLKAFMSGATTAIRSTGSFVVKGNVHANTIENLTIEKDAYYQALINSTVGGISYPGTPDPPPKVFPLSDANIQDWKNQAEGNGVVTGDITSCVSTLDSKKINGNVTFSNNCTVTVKSPVWITGNLVLGNGNILKLDPSYGVSSGVIIVDGQVTFENNNDLRGSGTTGSILMILSTYDSRSSGIAAIDVKNSGNSGVLYASKGIIIPGNNNNFRELTAWGIKLINNSTITYDVGLSSVLFSTGPSGSYSIVRGTYQSK